MSNLPPEWNQFDDHKAGLGGVGYIPTRAKRVPHTPIKNPITWEQRCKNQEYQYENGLLDHWEV